MLIVAATVHLVRLDLAEVGSAPRCMKAHCVDDGALNTGAPGVLSLVVSRLLTHSTLAQHFAVSYCSNDRLQFGQSAPCISWHANTVNAAIFPPTVPWRFAARTVMAYFCLTTGEALVVRFFPSSEATSRCHAQPYRRSVSLPLLHRINHLLNDCPRRRIDNDW